LGTNDWRSGLDLSRAVRETPTTFTANQLVRLLAGLCVPDWDPGRDLDPAVEPVRFTGTLHTAFPPGDIARAEVPATVLRAVAGTAETAAGAGEQAIVELATLSFGGPQGPLPASLLDELRARARAGDTGAVAFLDIFLHRLAGVGFRSQRHFRPDLESRRPAATRAERMPRALVGLLDGLDRSGRDRAGVPDRLLMRYTALLARRPMSGEAMRRLLADVLGTRVALKEAVGRWLDIDPGDCNSLGSVDGKNGLGRNLVLGDRAWLQTGGLRLTIGPVSLAAFTALLPGGAAHARVQALLRFMLNAPLRVEAMILLNGKETPAPHLDAAAPPRLGWTTWLGGPADDTPRQVAVTLLESHEWM